MKYYWLLFEILEICLSDVSHLDAIALLSLLLQPLNIKKSDIIASTPT
jgi:hypothetical protein